MWVVKIGGSLQTSRYLADWLKLLATYGGGRIIVVPGGGLYAEQVRLMQAVWKFNDLVAHEMALLCMEQYAHLLCHIEPELILASSVDELNACLENNSVPIWLPFSMVSKQKDIPASWAVTSDSLALWLAGQLQAETLILIKSTELSSNYISAKQLSTDGLVDDFFSCLLNHIKIPISWLLKSDYSELVSALRDEKVLEPRIFS